MDDLPPPIKVTPDFPNAPSPVSAQLAAKQPSFFTGALKYIIKIKWAKVSLYIISFIGVVNLIINIPAVKNFIEANFPNSSPVFAREVIMQGSLKSSALGLHTLVLPNGGVYALHFKPAVSLTSLKKVNEVLAKGNLTWTPFVIENVEIYPLNFTTSDDVDSPTAQIPPISQITPNPPNNSDIQLPKLYSGLQWESSQKKILLFTSGKRRLEVEGFHLESSVQTAFPQEFINYYIEGLKSAGFKETLNSINPEGITITYANGDLFLTFGVKNIYKGSGDNKRLTGYKAFIEHN